MRKPFVLLLLVLAGGCSWVGRRDGGASASTRVDLAELSLSLAQAQEPELDMAAMRQALDRLVVKARSEVSGTSNPEERVRRFNDVLLSGREVSYISNKRWRDSTLSAALLRRKGNCLATTTLYVVVAQKLGLPIRAVLAPHHVFARYDDGKTAINIETTQRGKSVPDSEYRSDPLLGDAESGLLGYGRSLTDAEFASVLYASAARCLLQGARREEALTLIEKAKTLWPGNPSHEFSRLWILYEGLGRRPEAVEGYRNLADQSESAETRAMALLALAYDRQTRSEHQVALVLLRQAYQIAPRYCEGQVLSAMASSYRSLRRFDEALVTQELSTVLGGDADDYTGLAIFYKNAGRLDDAIRCLRISLQMNSESWNTRLILAGYLIRAGQEAEGWRMFKTVEEPSHEDLQLFHTNMAWFFASIGRKKEFLEHLDQAFIEARTPWILNYIRTEVDFDRYREDAEFKALVERHRKRLEP